VLRQPQFAPLAFGEQLALLLATTEGVLDAVPLEKVEAFRAGLGPWLAQHSPETLGLDDQAATLAEGLRLTIALKELARSVAGPPVQDRR
jgi:F-type H+-transporting ATPase subunit alpha